MLVAGAREGNIRLSVSFFLKLIIVCFTCVNGSAIAAEQDSLKEIVRVYTSDYPPYSLFDDAGEVVGVSAVKVRALLDSIGLRYQITIVPWSRALLLIESNPNSLIFSLDRTPEREERFHWLSALNKVESHLIGRLGLMPDGFSKEKSLSGSYKAVCSRGSSACELLRQYGFSSDDIFAIAARRTTDLVTLLARGRADFIMEDPNVVSGTYGEASRLRTYDVIEHGVTDYLAASLNANPALIALVRSGMTAQTN